MEEGDNQDKKEIGKNLKEARSEEHFKCELNNGTLQIEYEFSSQITVDFYLLDLEILFSRNPYFMQKEGKNSGFSYIQPNH